MNRRYKGFMLVELLVVTIITALLATILSPVLIRAKERSNAMACMNNMKKISTAIQMYTRDYGGGLPSNNTYSIFFWYWQSVMLKNYVKNGNKIYQCPADDRPLTNTMRSGSVVPQGGPFAIGSYGMNEYIFNPFKSTVTKIRYNNINHLPNPAKTALVAEVHTNWLFCDWGTMQMYSVPGAASRTVPEGMARIIYANEMTAPTGKQRHEGGSYIVFCDGHAGYVAFDKFYYFAGGPGKPEWPIVDPGANSKY